MSKLTNQVAVVTGASKGIGVGIAKALAAEGAAVVVNYLSNKDGAERAVAEIVSNGGETVAVQPMFSEAGRYRATVRRDEEGVWVAGHIGEQCGDLFLFPAGGGDGGALP